MPINRKTGVVYRKTGKPFSELSPQITFQKRNGRKFTKTYRTRDAAARAAKAYRNKGGKVLSVGAFRRSGKGPFEGPHHTFEYRQNYRRFSQDTFGKGYKSANKKRKANGGRVGTHSQSWEDYNSWDFM